MNPLDRVLGQGTVKPLPCVSFGVTEDGEAAMQDRSSQSDWGETGDGEKVVSRMYMRSHSTVNLKGSHSTLRDKAKTVS